jgi:hypothetical protein
MSPIISLSIDLDLDEDEDDFDQLHLRPPCQQRGCGKAPVISTSVMFPFSEK